MTLPKVFKKRRGDASTLVDDLGFLVREPAETYHAQGDKFLTSHQLADFRRNPNATKSAENLGRLLRTPGAAAGVLG